MLERILGAASVYPFRCQLCTHRFIRLQWGARYAKGDRREFERVATRLPVTFQRGSGRREGVITDLSIAGCRLYTGAGIFQGETLAIAIQVPNPGTGRKPTTITVDVTGVCSVHPMRLGLRFVKMRPEEMERLKHLMHHFFITHLTEG